MARIELSRSYIHLATDLSQVIAVRIDKRTRAAGTIGDVELFSDGEFRSIGGAYKAVDVIKMSTTPDYLHVRDQLYNWRGLDVLVRTPFMDRFWAMLHTVTDSYNTETPGEGELEDGIDMEFLRVKDDV